MNRATLHAIGIILLVVLIWQLQGVTPKPGAEESSTPNPDHSGHYFSDNTSQSDNVNPLVQEGLVTNNDEPAVTSTDNVSSENQGLGYIHLPEVVPAKLYRNNIKQAELGDPRAQFLVTEALEPCHQLVYDSTEAINALEAQARTSDTVIKKLRRQLQICKSLYQTVGHDNIKKLHDYWLGQSAHNGNALARLISLFKNKTPPSQQLARPLLLEALTDLPANPRFAEKTFAMVLSYFYTFKEPRISPEARQAGHTKPSLEADTWAFLYCYFNRNCILDDYLKLMGNYYHEYELIAMKELASEYLAAIDEQNWAVLNL